MVTDEPDSQLDCLRPALNYSLSISTKMVQVHTATAHEYREPSTPQDGNLCRLRICALSSAATQGACDDQTRRVERELRGKYKLTTMDVTFASSSSSFLSDSDSFLPSYARTIVSGCRNVASSSVFITMHLCRRDIVPN